MGQAFIALGIANGLLPRPRNWHFDISAAQWTHNGLTVGVLAGGSARMFGNQEIAPTLSPLLSHVTPGNGLKNRGSPLFCFPKPWVGGSNPSMTTILHSYCWTVSNSTVRAVNY